MPTKSLDQKLILLSSDNDEVLFLKDDITFVGDLAHIRLPNISFYVAEDSQIAGEEVVKLWKNIKKTDKPFFKKTVGEEIFNNKKLLSEWFYDASENPEKWLAKYDNKERYISFSVGSRERQAYCLEDGSYDIFSNENINKILHNIFGFIPTVGYRFY